MSKREEVISQLEALAYCYKTKCSECKYSGRFPVTPGKYKTCGLPDDDEILEAAIELLKEQEAKPPRVHENAYGRKFYYCPKCNRAFDCFNQESYCHDCGQAVKWE